MFRIRSALLQTIKNNLRNNVPRRHSIKATNVDYSSHSTPVDYGTSGAGAGVQATKVTEKHPARMPLAKNFFIGVVDRELLAFPEVIARDDMNVLQNEVLPLRNFFEESVDTLAIDSTRTIPQEVVDGIRELGLYGINVPQEFDGKGWQWSQSLIATSEEAKCPDVALALLSHRVVIDVISELGSNDQKQRFLGKLAKGALVGSEAIYEYKSPEYDFFNTKADFDSVSRVWELNGEKSFVVTGPLPTGSSTLFLVVAQTQRSNLRGDASRGTTVFLVDSSCEGVKVGDQHLSLGLRGMRLSHVSFKGVRVPESCVLGSAHQGNQLAEHLLRSSRLRQSVVGLAQAKDAVREMAYHFLDMKQCGQSLVDMEINQVHMSKAMCATYAMESMIFMTSGLIDEFSEQDVALEAAITKYFTLTQLFKISSKYMDFLGPKSLLAGMKTDIFFRNASQMICTGESMDTLRLFIVLTGLQHAGVSMNDTVRKSRNPLFHPGHILSKFLQASNIEHPRTKMHLNERLHPSLAPAAQCIEHSVARLQMCVELLLTCYGNAVVERHNEMLRLTEMISTIYAMFASVSRASRSYCIGLQLADHELLTATAISSHGRDLVKTLATEIFNGQYVNNDNNWLRLGKQIVKSKGCFAVHPLTYNF